MGAMLVLACSKVETGNENTVKDDLLREVELTINVPQGDTKTYIEKSGSVYNPYWKNGDKLYVMTAADPSTKKTFTNGAENGADASFTGTINLAAGDNTLIAFYPQNVTKIDRTETTYKLSWGEGGADNDKQTLPSLTSFDPLHDILVAKPVVVNVAEAGSKTSVDMQFRRIMSVAKVVLVNATTNDYLDDAKVTSVKLTSSTTNLSGRICFDANTVNASVTSIDQTVSKSVTASYAGGDFAINGTNAAYIIVPPVTLATGSKLTVDVYTDKLGLTIHKEVDLAADLVFNAGAVKPLSVSLTDACVDYTPGPVLTVNVNSVSGVSYAGASGNTITSAYSIAGGDDSDIAVTYDGTVVTAASVSGGTVTYTTSTNSLTTRSGWVGLQAGTGAVQKIAVSQAYNPGNVTVYTWDFTTGNPATGSLAKTNVYLYNPAVTPATFTVAASHTEEHVLYVNSAKDPKVQSKNMSVTPKTKYLAISYGGADDYLFFNSTHAGLLTVLAAINGDGTCEMDVKVDGSASGSTFSLDVYDTTKEYLGAQSNSWTIANTTGDLQEIQMIKSTGSKSPWVFKVVFESIN